MRITLLEKKEEEEEENKKRKWKLHNKPFFKNTAAINLGYFLPQMRSDPKENFCAILHLALSCQLMTENKTSLI